MTEVRYEVSHSCLLRVRPNLSLSLLLTITSANNIDLGLLLGLFRTSRAHPLYSPTKKPMRNGIEQCFLQKKIPHLSRRYALSSQASSHCILFIAEHYKCRRAAFGESEKRNL